MANTGTAAHSAGAAPDLGKGAGAHSMSGAQLSTQDSNSWGCARSSVQLGTALR